MKYKSIFREEKIMSFTWDQGGERMQLLDVTQFDNIVLIYQDTLSVAYELNESFEKNQLN